MMAWNSHFKLLSRRIWVTRNARDQVPRPDLVAALQHHYGSGGGKRERPPHRVKPVQTGCRLLSAHRAANGVKFWVITEPDRSATVLLPQEYR